MSGAGKVVGYVFGNSSTVNNVLSNSISYGSSGKTTSDQISVGLGVGSTT